MNNRLQKFLDAENITQSQLAEKLGVAKASISHILAGRNKPGFDFILSMSQCYPDLNLDWLIAGKGKMYKSSSEPRSPEPRENPQSTNQGESNGLLFEPQEPEISSLKAESAGNKPVTESAPPAASKRAQPRISRILVFYDNGTFNEID